MVSDVWQTPKARRLLALETGLTQHLDLFLSSFSQHSPLPPLPRPHYRPDILTVSLYEQCVAAISF